MRMLIPLFFVFAVNSRITLKFLRNTVSSLLPLMIDQVMKDNYDRFAINRWTGYVTLCDSAIGIICTFSFILLASLGCGFLVPIWGKKPIIYFIMFFSFLSLSYLHLLTFVKVNVFFKFNREVLDLNGS